MPWSIDLSISCCLVSFFAAFFLVLAGSVVVVVSFEVDAGGVVAAAGAGVVVAAGAGVVVAAGGVVVVAAGAVVVAPVPLPDEVWASTAPAGKDTKAIIVAIRKAFCMEKTPTLARPAMQSA
ncbi:MAG: hypothetical protein WAV72_23305 [Bradyrhizobium sp.]